MTPIGCIRCFWLATFFLLPSAMVGQDAPPPDCMGAEFEAVELRDAAKVGEPYESALPEMYQRFSEFSSIPGNTGWLRLDQNRRLVGTPPPGAPSESAIAVCARAGDEAPGPKVIRLAILVQVLPKNCIDQKSGALVWCREETTKEIRPPGKQRFAFAPEDGYVIPPDPECNGPDGCILQFDRLSGERGMFGHFSLAAHHSWWFERLSPADFEKSIIDAINGSKVFISGAVLIRKDVPACRFWSWQIMAQTEDSSNNLYYGPSDVSAFCTQDRTALIVLPVHAIWASVYGTLANTNDPSWKPVSEPPHSHECWSGNELISGIPGQGIKPCDARLKVPGQNDKVYGDEKSKWPLRKVFYSPPVRFSYNHLAQPGVSQGSISIAPVDGSTKATFDVQAYESTLLGRGWLGLQTVYEHDRNPKDDLNSFTAALSYDLRLWNTETATFCHNYHDAGSPVTDCPQYLPSDSPVTRVTEKIARRWWHEWFAEQSWSATCFKGLGRATEGDCGPPWIGIRPAELSFRAGPEWSPDSFSYPGGSKPTQQYLPRALNFVMGPTVRLPIIFSPKIPYAQRRPSQFTLVPLAGFEGGFRVISHEIGDGMTCGAMRSCSGLPEGILRQVYGFDASANWPYNITHNFLGDRPLTFDFSYRMRRLEYREPFANEMDFVHMAMNAVSEGQYAGGREYTRLTFIWPISPYLQTRATWQHGALPPNFQFVGNEVTFGLTFSNPGWTEH